jgi:hypothetical protein
MSDGGMMSVGRIRERAELCRQCARQARLDGIHGIANELERLARDYDIDADRLEAWSPDPTMALAQ